MDFWPKLQIVLNLSEPGLILSNHVKIFGALSRDKISQLVLNYLIQNAQKCIWKNRQKLENRDLDIDLWSDFKERLLFNMNRLYRMMGKNYFASHFVRQRIVKISRYKPVLNFV